MAGSATRGPLDPGPDDRETALAARWRRLREGVPPTLYLLACAVVLALALVGVGWVLAKVVHDDGAGRASTTPPSSPPRSAAPCPSPPWP